METQNTEELHTITGIVYQNILELTPSLRELATSAKQYQKALQNVSSEALKYYQALGKVAQSALASKGSVRGLGDAIIDMIEVHKNIESQRLGIINYLSSDLIAPLETLTETNPVRIKSCHKGYNHDVKAKAEAVERAKNELNKVRKKSQRKKFTEKYEEKEKQCDEELTKAQKQLDEFRISGCKAALSEERKLHSFVLDRATIIAKSSMEFYDHSAQLLSTKVPVWFSLIKKRPSLSAMVIEENGHTTQPLGGDVPDGFLDGRIKLRALFPHTAEEASQLSFKEGDIVDPISDVVSGWQYGENLRTNKHGWFPSQFMEKILAAHTAPTASQTMPVSGGQHSRPPLDAGIPNKSPKLRRYVSGPTPPLPQPDYLGKETKNPGVTPVTEPPTTAAETSDTGEKPSSPITASHTLPKMTRSASASGITKSGISKSCTPPPPPPPPPPFAPDDPPESKESEEQASPFAGVQLKKTVTDDRSAPKIS